MNRNTEANKIYFL